MMERKISKSSAFRIIKKIPFDFAEGMSITFDDGTTAKITKVKSVKFIDMRTIEIIGLSKQIY